MKRCSKCGTEKPLGDFHRNSAQADGLQNQCKSCKAETGKRWRDTNPDYWRSRDPDYARRHSREWAARNRHKRYGITQEQYEEMMSRPCAMCGSRDRLCVDHDHKCCPGPRSCGQCVRGTLCHGCNTLIGFAEDSILKLAAGISYLTSSS